MNKMIKYKTRDADEQDIDQMIDLLELLFSIEADFTINKDKQRKGLELLLSDNNSHIIVLEGENKKIIGMSTLQILVSTAEGGKTGLIEDVIIDEAYRSKGAGRAIMNAMNQIADELKLKRLQLLADKNNKAALEFYKRIGWSGTDLICLRKMAP